MGDKVSQVGAGRARLPTGPGADPGDLRAHDVQILKGHISKGHVHLLVSTPPEVAISLLVQCLKGKTAHKILQEFAPLRREFWGRHLWSRGYFCCCSSGDVTDQVIAAHIAHQGEPGPGDFRVEHGDF